MIQLSPMSDLENLMRRPSFRKLYFDPIEIPWASEFGVTGDAAQTHALRGKTPGISEMSCSAGPTRARMPGPLRTLFVVPESLGLPVAKTTGAGQAITRAGSSSIPLEGSSFVAKPTRRIRLALSAHWRLQDLRRSTIDGR